RAAGRAGAIRGGRRRVARGGRGDAGRERGQGMKSKVTAIGKAAGDEGRPISEVIRDRIKAAGRRFHANDNIAEFIHSDEERAQLRREVEVQVEGLLRALVIDTES